MAIKEPRGDRIFGAVVFVIVTLLMLIVLYPLIYVLSCSFSDPLTVVQSKIRLLPQKPTLIAYQRVFRNELVMSGYKNTILYTLLGTALNVVVTTMTACSAAAISPSAGQSPCSRPLRCSSPAAWSRPFLWSRR